MNPVLSRRLSASLIDLLGYLCLVIAGFLSTLLIPYELQSRVWNGLFVIALLPAIVLALIEARWGASPGKLITGLRLETSSRRGWLPRLLLRNLSKYSSIGLWIYALLLIVLGGDLGAEALFQNSLLGLGLLALLLNAGLLRASEQAPGKSLYDWICATHVSDSGKVRPGRQWLALPAGAAIGLMFLAIVLPMLQPACACGGPSIKANMHTLQTMVETYAVDWGGEYPPNLTALKADASLPAKAYWKAFANPLPVKTREKILLWELEMTKEGVTGIGNALVEEGRAIRPGIVSYAVSPERTTYWIYGYDDKNRRIQDKGKNYFLTNS